MIALKLQYFVQSGVGFFIIAKTDFAQRDQIAAIDRIAKLDVAWKYFQFRKGYSEVIIGDFIKEMLFTESFQLMVAFGRFLSVTKSSIASP